MYLPVVEIRGGGDHFRQDINILRKDGSPNVSAER
jgi:hypothetical protein